jgi:hypothetical protein
VGGVWEIANRFFGTDHTLVESLGITFHPILFFESDLTSLLLLSTSLGGVLPILQSFGFSGRAFTGGFWKAK